MTGWPHGRIRFMAQLGRGHRVRFGSDEQGEKSESDGGENHCLVNRLLVRAPKKIFVPAPALRLMAKESCRKHGIPAMGSAPPEACKTCTAGKSARRKHSRGGESKTPSTRGRRRNSRCGSNYQPGPAGLIVSCVLGCCPVVSPTTPTPVLTVSPATTVGLLETLFAVFRTCWATSGAAA